MVALTISSPATIITNTERIARTRHIFDTAQAMGAHVYSLWGKHEGLRYPVLNLQTGESFLDDAGKPVYRWTAFDKETAIAAKGKYKWLPAMPAGDWGGWYAGLNIRSAVRKAHGRCYLANGEKALWSFHAAGIYNVIATTLSEVTIPPNATSILKTLGVEDFIYIFDNDAAGLKSAQGWVDALNGSGIYISVKKWADDENSIVKGYDANDALIQAAGDKEAFIQIVENAPRVFLTATPPYVPPVRAAGSNHAHGGGRVDWDAVGGAIVAEVESRGGKMGKTWTRNISCPNPAHVDDTPSFGVNGHGVGHCFACGAMSVRQVADYLLIDLSRYTEASPVRSLPKPTSPQVSNVQLSNLDTLDTLDTSDDARFLQPAMPTIQDIDERAKQYAKMVFNSQHGSYKVVDSLWERGKMPLGWYVALAQISPFVARFVYKISQAAADGAVDVGETVDALARIAGTSRQYAQRTIDFLDNIVFACVGTKKQQKGRSAKLWALLDIRFKDIEQAVLQALCLRENQVSGSLHDTSALGVSHSALIEYGQKPDFLLERIQSMLKTEIYAPDIQDARSLTDAEFTREFIRLRIAQAGDEGLTISQGNLAFELGVTTATIASHVKALSDEGKIVIQENKKTIDLDFTQKIGKQNRGDVSDEKLFFQAIADIEAAHRGRAMSLHLENWSNEGEQNDYEQYNLLSHHRVATIKRLVHLYMDGSVGAKVVVRTANTYFIQDSEPQPSVSDAGSKTDKPRKRVLDGLPAIEKPKGDAGKHLLPRAQDLPISTQRWQAIVGTARIVDFTLRVTAGLRLDALNRVIDIASGAVVFEHAIDCYDDLREHGVTDRIGEAIRTARAQHAIDSLTGDLPEDEDIPF